MLEDICADDAVREERDVDLFDAGLLDSLAAIEALARAAGVPARVRTWFYSDATSAALAWLAAIALCAGVLAWFFVASPYGAPAAPVYAEF